MSKPKINPEWLKAQYRIEFLIENEPMFKRKPYTLQELMRKPKRISSFNAKHGTVMKTVAKVVKAYKKK